MAFTSNLVIYRINKISPRTPNFLREILPQHVPLKCFVCVPLLKRDHTAFRRSLLITRRNPQVHLVRHSVTQSCHDPAAAHIPESTKTPCRDARRCPAGPSSGHQRFSPDSGCNQAAGRNRGYEPLHRGKHHRVSKLHLAR